jgi:hypothetical protein
MAARTTGIRFRRARAAARSAGVRPDEPVSARALDLAGARFAPTDLDATDLDAADLDAAFDAFRSALRLRIPDFVGPDFFDAAFVAAAFVPAGRLAAVGFEVVGFFRGVGRPAVVVGRRVVALGLVGRFVVLSLA